MIDLITGHQGVAHISAEQVSTINKSMMNGYGSGQIVRLKDGTITDGTLSVIVSTGYWRMDGYDMEIQESDTLLLDPVTNPGDSRIDIIFVELLQDIATGVQRCEYVIVQGEEDPTPSEPLAPTEPQNDTDRLILATPLCKCTVHDDDTMDFVDLTIEFDVQAGPRIFLGNSSTWDDMSLDERAYYDNCEVIFEDGGPYHYHIYIYYASSDTLSPIAGDPGPAMAKTPKFATCNTASGTAIKVATTLDNDFVLQTGSAVFVQFDYITATVTDPKLNVDNTGAKLIKAYGTTKPARWWSQGDIVQFVYDGTYWIMYPTSGQINNIDTDITNLNASLTQKEDKTFLGYGDRGFTGSYTPDTDYPDYDWEEMFFIAKYANIEVTLILKRKQVEDFSGTIPHTLLAGWYTTSTNNGAVSIQYNKTKFSLYNFYVNGANQTSATCDVYYR